MERVEESVWRAPHDLVDRGKANDAERATGPIVDVRSELSVTQQTRVVGGATWLYREFVKPGNGVAASGFGAEVREALVVRQEFLVEERLANRQGQRLHLMRDLLATLRTRELSQVGGGIEAGTRIAYRELGDGQRASGVYRRSLMLASGRFAVLEDSGSFALVPWRPVIEARLGQSISAVMDGSRVSWEFGRQRGLSR